MGAAFSRNENNNGNGGGLYFGNQFTMGGSNFQTMTPESFLFGDVAELAWLSRVPGSVPRIPPNVKHTNTVRCLVNIHKDTIKLVRHSQGDEPTNEYHLSFNFDADQACAITVHQFVQEAQDKMGNLVFKNYKRTPALETIAMPAGYGQTFNFPNLALNNLHTLSPDDLTFQATDEMLRFPLAIEIKLASGQPLPVRDPDGSGNNHSQITYAAYEQASSGLNLKIVAQKVNVDGRSYLLREIYGIERKNHEQPDNDDNDDDDDDEEDVECVVCMSESMDTMVLPCRHLCLCNGCADVLRYQASKCPICRAPFHSLLQIQVAKREQDLSEDVLEATEGQEDAPRDYRLIPVVDALKTKEVGYISIQADDNDAESAQAAPEEAAAAAASPVAVAAGYDEDTAEHTPTSKVNPLFGKSV
eukprot:m.145543 g.145543  ORF g.145543 m.145543 type:complete len:416 (+) comp16217_c0_seq28:152-1399(+)